MNIQFYAIRLVVGICLGFVAALWCGWDLSEHGTRPFLIAILIAQLPIEQWYSIAALKKVIANQGWVFPVVLSGIVIEIPNAISISLAGSSHPESPAYQMLSWFSDIAPLISLFYLAFIWLWLCRMAENRPALIQSVVETKQ